ncbi:MAG: glycosyltransferase family 4 protein [Thermoplasmatales archaeon]|nr:glycosyltransferase family 4 protein [Thermoplasmatales archaeon]
MKIAFIHHTLVIGSGIDTVIWELAHRLKGEHDVKIFTFLNEYPSGLVKVVNIPFNENKVINSVFSPFLPNSYKLRGLIKEFDVVNVHHYPANFFPFFPKKLETFNIVTEWSGPPLSLLKNLSLKEKFYIKFIMAMNKYAALRADDLIAPCDFVKKWIKDNYGLDSRKIYLDGINFDYFNFKKYKKEKIDFGGPIILYVGRIAPNKNIDILIESFETVKRELEDSKLVIVGRKTFPEYYKKLKNFLKKRKLEESVIFTGEVSWDDLPLYYASCDVFATCSAWEGFLRAEAFAMKKPMVAFDAGANKETIKDGINGFLVKEKSPEAFANALIKILEDNNLRKKMGKNGYKWAKENLDFDVIAKNFSKYITEVTN